MKPLHCEHCKGIRWCDGEDHVYECAMCDKPPAPEPKPMAVAIMVSKPFQDHIDNVRLDYSNHLTRKHRMAGRVLDL